MLTIPYDYTHTYYLNCLLTDGFEVSGRLLNYSRLLASNKPLFYLRRHLAVIDKFNFFEKCRIWH